MISRRSFLTGVAAAALVPAIAPRLVYSPLYDGEVVVFEGVKIVERPTTLTMQHVLRAADLARKQHIPPIVYDGQPHYLLVWSEKEKRYVFRASAEV